MAEQDEKHCSHSINTHTHTHSNSNVHNYDVKMMHVCTVRVI